MSHKRLAVNNIAKGTDLDSVGYVDEYRCDGCQRVASAKELIRLQGQIYHNTATGYINADLCERCVDHQPVSVIMHLV